MKKIINSPETIVLEMCNGIVLAHTELEFDAKFKVIKKKKLDKTKVTLISGGGSGHEPAHAGFVGEGMLDAAVCGDVFASPSQIQVYAALRATKSDAGTLLIIKNYSGDIMNFKNAALMASEDGIKVDYIKVDDDVAVEDSLYTVGHRGVAGTVLVHKIAGAAAQNKLSLEKVKLVAQKAADNVKSIGFAFSSCTVPAKGSPTFELGADEMEYGVGIHGEPGIRKEKIVSADELAKKMVDHILKDFNIKSGEQVAVVVNGFGATPLMELYLLNNSVLRELSQRKIEVVRTFVGNYMTSIDMGGASVSIMRLDEETKALLCQKSDAPAFKVSGETEKPVYSNVLAHIQNHSKAPNFDIQTDPKFAIIQNNTITLDNLVYIVDAMSESIIRNEQFFCELDSHAGDGDFGMSVAKGFKQLKIEWDDIVQNKTVESFLDACSIIIMEHCGGASGPIWGSAFRAASKKAATIQKPSELSLVEFANLVQAAVVGIQTTGERSFGRGAVVGDKTLIDALVPCAMALLESAKNNDSVKKAFENGAKAAVDGAKATEKIVARMGRAGTVGERSIGFPDAGAHGLGVIFTDISKAIK